MLRLVVNKQFMTEQEENQAIADLRAKGWEVKVDDDYIDWDDRSYDYDDDDYYEYGGYEM